MSGNEQKKAPRPVPVARASMVWDDIAPHERSGAVLPAASVRTRIDAERARTSLRARLEVRSTLVLVSAGLLVGLGVGSVTRSTSGLIAAVVAGLVLGVAAAGAWSWLTGGPIVRQLRRQMRREIRVAKSLGPLESAGWTVLHDRLVAAHRVPHVLIGPAGVVLVYDYLAGSSWRYQGRRSGALLHSAISLLLAVPLVLLHRRGLPPLSGSTPVKLVSPGDDAIRTAVWARSELATRLGHRPELDGWTVTVTSFYVLLNRPPDRLPETGAGIGFADIGERMRTHMETALPAGLTRDAAAFLAVVVDETCAPA